jgi:hypothetical protein
MSNYFTYLFIIICIDFEFETEAQKDAFVQPDFCLVDITQETFIAGGMLAEKRYGEIEGELKYFSYKKLDI